MAHLTPSLQQQSEQHSNPLRNASCSGLTVRAKQQFSGWRGLTLQTSGWGCLQAQVGQLGGCWELWAAGASQLPSVSYAGRNSILKLCPTHGQWREGSMVNPPTISHHPDQHRVSWQGDKAAASPKASQHSSASKSISAHAPPPPCPCPTCPMLWPKLSSCLIPALYHSFTLCGRKETAHCQISYLKGNLATFIEPLSWSLGCHRQSL